MKKKFIVTFALCGAGIALVIGTVRLYLFYTDPLSDVLNSDAFFILTLILWPGSFYLGILKDAEPLKEVLFVFVVAILFNAAVYAGFGWLAWRFARFMELVGPD